MFLAPYKRQILYALIALIFTTSLTLSIGQGVRLLIDQGIATASPQRLGQYVLVFLGLVLALSITTYTRHYWVSWLGERVVADIRTTVFNHLINLHPAFFEQNRALEIQSRITTDTTLLQSVIGASLSMALRNIIMMVGGTIWLFITNAKLAGIVALTVPLVITPILIFGRRVRKLSKKSQDRVADVGAYVGEILGHIKIVQAYNHEDRDKQRFGDFSEAAFDIARKRIVQRGLLIVVVIALVMGAVGMLLWVGGLDVIKGRITGGELAAFVFYSVIVGMSVTSISEVMGELQRAAGAAQRIVELLQSRSDIESPDQPVPLSLPVRGQIEISHLTFSYPGRSETPALDNLTLTIAAGETLALVGPSGAGKSTLFDLLLRFSDCDAGVIRLDGVDIRDLSLQDLRSCFALVSQTPTLFYGSIADNIRYARPDADQALVEQAAQAAHAHEFITKLPEGYDTRLGDAGIGLSGGQKQRLAIARAILADAPILLLDEATSALDAQSEYWVQEALEKLMVGRTTLVIAHRLATVQNASRIAVMNEGRLESVDTHQQLMQNNPLYHRMASLQFKAYSL